MIPRETLPVPQLRLASMAVLAAVPVASEEECVGDLAAEAAGNVDELYQANDGRFGQREAFASDKVTGIGLHDFCFAFDDQTKGSTQRDHGQRLERGVQRQTPHCASPEMQWITGDTRMPWARRSGAGSSGIVIPRGLPSKTAHLC